MPRPTPRLTATERAGKLAYIREMLQSAAIFAVQAQHTDEAEKIADLIGDAQADLERAMKMADQLIED